MKKAQSMSKPILIIIYNLLIIIYIDIYNIYKNEICDTSKKTTETLRLRLEKRIRYGYILVN